LTFDNSFQFFSVNWTEEIDLEVIDLDVIDLEVIDLEVIDLEVNDPGFNVFTQPVMDKGQVWM